MGHHNRKHYWLLPRELGEVLSAMFRRHYYLKCSRCGLIITDRPPFLSRWQRLRRALFPPRLGESDLYFVSPDGTAVAMEGTPDPPCEAARR